MSTTSNTPEREVTRHDDRDDGTRSVPEGVPFVEGAVIDREELAAALANAIRSDLFSAVQDLGWLHRNGALGGVHEVIRERRRQVEALGYTPEGDDSHIGDGLIAMADIRLSDLRAARGDGTADPAGDERELRQAGALLAAEIDRLHRMMTPPGAQ